jgi:ectoine hydroxylase-related dioxygenase (phytanoyl-CoA dioxygenase family)
LFVHGGNVQDTVFTDGTHATVNMAFRSEYHDGRLYTSQVKTLIYLSDVTSPAEGAFCYLQGSHKAQFAFPWSDSGAAPGQRLCDSGFPGMGLVLPRAGDLLLLNEGLAHGAMRTRTRRYLLSYLWAPAFMADFQRIHPRRGELHAAGYYDADYERAAAGDTFPVDAQSATGAIAGAAHARAGDR